MTIEDRQVKFILSAQDRASAVVNGMRSNLGNLGNQVSGLNGLLGRFGVVFGGAFAGATLTAFIRGTAEGLDKLNDLADATGASVENLSALEDVAARTGTSFEAVGTSVVKLNKVLNEAKPGDATSNILKALGLDAERLRQIDPAEALRQVAVALRGYADDQKKARIVQELFGKSVREVAPLLNDLATQGALVATVTSDQAREAERFNQELSRLQKNATDSGRALVSGLLPALNKLFERGREGAANGGFLNRWFAEIKANLASDDLRVVTGRIEMIQQTIQRQGATPKLLKDLAALREEADRLTAKALAASDAVKGTFAAPPAPRDARRALRDAENAIAERPSLPSVIDATPKVPKKKNTDLVGPEVPDFLRDAQKAIDEVDSAKVRDLRLQLQQLISIRAVSGAGRVDEAILDVEEALARLDPAARAAAESKQRLDALLANTPSAELKRAREEMDLLAAALAKAADPEQVKQIQEAMEAVAERIGAMPTTSEKAFDEMEELAKQAARNIQSALGDTIYRTFKRDTDNLLELWADMLLRMAAEAAAAQLGKYLLGDGGITGLGTKIGSGIGSLLSLFGGFFAEGGTLGAGKWGIAGERGPEVIRGPAEVVPLNRSQASAAGSSVVNNFNVGAGVQRHEVLALLNQFASVLMGQVDRRLARVGA